MNVKDRVAVVTGAGSGIGRAIALSLARRGCHLALADLNPQTLAQTVEQAKALGVRVTAHPLDVTDRAAGRALPDDVVAVHGRVDLLINNAGIAAGGTFEQVSEPDFDRVIDVNFGAVVRLTRAFLPHLHRSDDARLVNLSSVFGLISPPEQSAYSASKFAVRGFSNALRHELEGSSVAVTVVHPGGVATAIARSALIPAGATAAAIAQKQALQGRLLRMPPERAGERIVRGIEQRKARILVGTDARVIAWVERLMPVGYWAVLQKLANQR